MQTMLGCCSHLGFNDVEWIACLQCLQKYEFKSCYIFMPKVVLSQQSCKCLIISAGESGRLDNIKPVHAFTQLSLAIKVVFDLMHHIFSTGFETRGSPWGCLETAFPKIFKHFFKLVQGRCLEYNGISSYKVRHKFNIDIIENRVNNMVQTHQPFVIKQD